MRGKNHDFGTSAILSEGAEREFNISKGFLVGLYGKVPSTGKRTKCPDKTMKRKGILKLLSDKYYFIFVDFPTIEEISMLHVVRGKGSLVVS